jgi:hypothetical protein
LLFNPAKIHIHTLNRHRRKDFDLFLHPICSHAYILWVAWMMYLTLQSSSRWFAIAPCVKHIPARQETIYYQREFRASTCIVGARNQKLARLDRLNHLSLSAFLPNVQLPCRTTTPTPTPRSSLSLPASLSPQPLRLSHVKSCSAVYPTMRPSMISE